MMNDEISIRAAQGADVDALIAFNQAMALETEGKQLKEEILRAGVESVFADERKGFYVVAESEGKIIGGLMVTNEWSDWRNRWFWWIQSVYILPDFRRRGVYRKLYDFVREGAIKRGDVCGFRLYVEHENERAQKTYENLGMKQSHYLMYEEDI